jgi:ribosome modulation factor
MPIDRQHSQDYQDGKKAWRDGRDLADKPTLMLRNEWEAGWHDAMAEAVRGLLKK